MKNKKSHHKNKRKYKYGAIPGTKLTDEDAAVVGPEIRELKLRLAAQKQIITAEAVVSEAESKNSPLHSYFEWDDAKAGYAHRLWQARQLIASVRWIEVGVPADEQPVIRAFVHVRAAEYETEFEGSGYMPVTEVKNSDVYRTQVLERGKAELLSFKRRYADYEQFFGSVFKAIEELAET